MTGKNLRKPLLPSSSTGMVRSCSASVWTCLATPSRLRTPHRSCSSCSRERPGRSANRHRLARGCMALRSASPADSGARPRAGEPLSGGRPRSCTSFRRRNRGTNPWTTPSCTRKSIGCPRSTESPSSFATCRVKPRFRLPRRWAGPWAPSRFACIAAGNACVPD